MAVHCPIVKNEVLRRVIWNICPTLTICSLGDNSVKQNKSFCDLNAHANLHYFLNNGGALNHRLGVDRRRHILSVFPPPSLPLQWSQPLSDFRIERAPTWSFPATSLLGKWTNPRNVRISVWANGNGLEVEQLKLGNIVQVYYRSWWEGDVITYCDMQQVVELNFCLAG